MWHIINADLRLDEIEKKITKELRDQKKPSQESVKVKLVLKMRSILSLKREL